MNKLEYSIRQIPFHLDREVDQESNSGDNDVPGIGGKRKRSTPIVESVMGQPPLDVECKFDQESHLVDSCSIHLGEKVDFNVDEESGLLVCVSDDSESVFCVSDDSDSVFKFISMDRIDTVDLFV